MSAFFYELIYTRQVRNPPCLGVARLVAPQHPHLFGE